MAKKTKLPLTEELLKQAAPISSLSAEEYNEEDKRFSELHPREQERTESIHHLKQIRTLLYLLCKERGLFKEEND